MLVVGVLAYAASYFARGFLAGHQRFELYGLLVFLEAVSRVCFALAVVVGLASGQSAVALGMAIAPLMSLLVVPWFFARRDPPADPGAVRETEGGLTMRHGLGFAVAVFAIMLAEQTLLNAAVLTVEGTSGDAVLAGVVFSVLMITRAPLQLFQAVQGSLLPHLAGLQATAGADEFRRAVRITVLAIAGFALAVAIGLFAIGPPVVSTIFDIDRDIARAGLALVGLGMGFHLIAGTLNQAALARGQARGAAIAWLVSAAAFLIWMLSPAVDDQLLRTEVGYCCATAAAQPPAGARLPFGSGRRVDRRAALALDVDEPPVLQAEHLADATAGARHGLLAQAHGLDRLALLDDQRLAVGLGAQDRHVLLRQQVGEVDGLQRGEQEGHREHDAEVEEVYEAVERVAAAVAAPAGARVDAAARDGVHRLGSGGSRAATTYSRSDRSWA